MTQHWGRGHLTIGHSASSGDTVKEAIAGSTAGMCSRPVSDALCMATNVLPSAERRDRAAGSLQQACNSLRYSSKGGTAKVVEALPRLKKALPGTDAGCCGTSKPIGVPEPCVRPIASSYPVSLPELRADEREPTSEAREVSSSISSKK